MTQVAPAAPGTIFVKDTNSHSLFSSHNSLNDLASHHTYSRHHGDTGADTGMTMEPGYAAHSHKSTESKSTKLDSSEEEEHHHVPYIHINQEMERNPFGIE